MNTENVKSTVLNFLEALNNEDWDTARQQVADDLVFIGVMGSRQGADVYFEDMKKMKIKYDIRQSVAEAVDVCLFYELLLDGKSIPGMGWYHLKEGKINTIRVLFDPRPLL